MNAWNWLFGASAGTLSYRLNCRTYADVDAFRQWMVDQPRNLLTIEDYIHIYSNR